MSLPTNTSTKVRNLLKLLDLDDIGIEPLQHGPYALVLIGRALCVVGDVETDFDSMQLIQQIDELRLKPEYRELSFYTFKPRQFLAFLVTGCLFTGFHDKMASSIKIDILISRPFLGGWKPNYKKIESLLREAGFEKVVD